MAGWTAYQLFLAGLMLITGSINTLSTKWADNSSAKGRLFDHPFLQAVGMFIGELTCLLAFHILFCYRRTTNTVDKMDTGNQRFNPLVFGPAAMCDMLGTSIMYVGLNLTYASSFQMLRGAVMIFTALLSVAFLGRVIKARMWIGMVLVLIGLALVGIADIVFHQASSDDSRDINSVITGDLLIIIAQIVVATQMVYEEKVLTKYNVPALQAVGWEGFFGCVVLGSLLLPFYYIKVGRPFSSDSEGRLENVPFAFEQMKVNPVIIVASLGNIISIAFFNFSGISVTKEISATTRMVLDSCRTLIIWIVSLAVGWQPFGVKSFFVQLAGFLLLVAGMCVYNDVIITPALRRCRVLDPEPTAPEPRPTLADAPRTEDEDEPILVPASQYGVNPDDEHLINA